MSKKKKLKHLHRFNEAHDGLLTPVGVEPTDPRTAQRFGEGAGLQVMRVTGATVGEAHIELTRPERTVTK